MDFPQDTSPAKAEALQLARARIVELQSKIKSEYGLDVRCGIELEFNGAKGGHAKLLHTSVLKGIMKDVPFFTEAVNDSKNDSMQNLIAAIGTPIAGLIGASESVACAAVMSAVAIAFIKIIPGTIARQYEVKFDTYDKDGKIFGDLSELSQSVRSTRALLNEQESKKALGVRDVNFHSRKYYNPLRLGYASCLSMHVNMSLWEKDGKNVTSDADINRNCGQAILDMQHEAALGMINTKNAYDIALPKGFCGPKTIDISTKKGGYTLSDRGWNGTDSKRHENRMPRADSDPEFAIVTSLGALYEGLQRHASEQKDGITTADIADRAIPKSLDEAVERFGKSQICERVLGKDLFDSMLKCHQPEKSLAI